MSSVVHTLWIGGREGSVLGEIWAAFSPRGLAAVGVGTSEEKFLATLQKPGAPVQIVQNDGRVNAALQQIEEYLAGKRRRFELEIDWSGMAPFQERVLHATIDIPYGETRTYQQLALQTGSPAAGRAVGRAQATNPMPLVIPCHRVIGSDGSLRGYGAGEGIPTKRWLLEMERRAAQARLF